MCSPETLKRPQVRTSRPAGRKINGTHLAWHVPQTTIFRYRFLMESGTGNVRSEECNPILSVQNRSGNGEVNSRDRRRDRVCLRPLQERSRDRPATATLHDPQARQSAAESHVCHTQRRAPFIRKCSPRRLALRPTVFRPFPCTWKPCPNGWFLNLIIFTLTIKHT